MGQGGALGRHRSGDVSRLRYPINCTVGGGGGRGRRRRGWDRGVHWDVTGPGMSHV